MSRSKIVKRFSQIIREWWSVIRYLKNSTFKSPQRAPCSFYLINALSFYKIKEKIEM